jgi:hypothetical protein
MLTITSNGSKWAGEAPDELGKLLERLEKNTLHPMFEQYGDFILPPTVAHDRVTRFWGNFIDVSAVFSIDTDEAAMVKMLTDAIRANQATERYREAAKHVHEAKRLEAEYRARKDAERQEERKKSALRTLGQIA